MHFLVFLTMILQIQLNTYAEKLNLDTLNNYSEFLNFGDKKVHKINKEKLENSIFKSKIDILGEVFKKNIDSIKLSPKLDIIFLIDASSSVGESNFQSELKFVKKLLSDITVDYNHTRVAIVTFSSLNNIVSDLFYTNSFINRYRIIQNHYIIQLVRLLTFKMIVFIIHYNLVPLKCNTGYNSTTFFIKMRYSQ